MLKASLERFLKAVKSVMLSVTAPYVEGVFTVVRNADPGKSCFVLHIVFAIKGTAFKINANDAHLLPFALLAERMAASMASLDRASFITSA